MNFYLFGGSRVKTDRGKYDTTWAFGLSWKVKFSIHSGYKGTDLSYDMLCELIILDNSPKDTCKYINLILDLKNTKKRKTNYAMHFMMYLFHRLRKKMRRTREIF